MHLTAPSHWSRSIGTGGRDPSEQVVTIVGMRSPGTVSDETGRYAFDLLQLDGEDLGGSLPLGDRKKRLARLLGSKRRLGIGTQRAHRRGRRNDLSPGLPRSGLEGIVSKRLGAPYRSGPSRDWIKVKNPDSPATMRHREVHW